VGVHNAKNIPFDIGLELEIFSTSLAFGNIIDLAAAVSPPRCSREGGGGIGDTTTTTTHSNSQSGGTSVTAISGRCGSGDVSRREQAASGRENSIVAAFAVLGEVASSSGPVVSPAIGKRGAGNWKWHYRDLEHKPHGPDSCYEKRSVHHKITVFLLPHDSPSFFVHADYDMIWATTNKRQHECETAPNVCLVETIGPIKAKMEEEWTFTK